MMRPSHSSITATVLLLAITLIFSQQDHAAEAMSIQFRWKAELNSKNDRATSRETSQFHLRKSNILATQDSRQKLCQLYERMVTNYPTWLCKKNMTFGLFRPSIVKDDDATNLQLKLGRINMLTFGVPKLSAAPDGGISSCAIQIPVEGGLLSLPPDAENNDQGRLEFSLDAIPAEDDSILVKLTTKIDGNYRPSIGGSPPVPIYRKAMYRFTQSVVHAYVMWRFHRATASAMRELVSLY
mmetsp:Transcript_5022/g.14638  ORF Transcript_5022/g.14638 Transcript_5022/m.14638 type:complete len:240 (-) Transcript_5022:69-788(-)